MRTRIGGALDYARLAQLHRPADQDAIGREVRRLAGEGLTDRDISQALGLDPAAVSRLALSRFAKV